MVVTLDLASIRTRPGFTAKEPLRGGPPLEEAALLERLQSLLHDDPALFLERYGMVLHTHELSRFDEDGGYEVRWHLQQLRRSDEQVDQSRRNRRFRRMQELLRDSDYFSLQRMEERAPSLCRQYMGMPTPAEFDSALPLSSRLLASLDHQACAAAAEEEEEEEDEDEDDYESNAWTQLQAEQEARDGAPGGGGGGQTAEAEGNGAGPEAASDPVAEARAAAFEELLMIMKERFLNGEDGPWFDYRTVDGADRYDDGERARDEEERYFEDDD